MNNKSNELPVGGKTLFAVARKLGCRIFYDVSSDKKGVHRKAYTRIKGHKAHKLTTQVKDVFGAENVKLYSSWGGHLQVIRIQRSK